MEKYLSDDFCKEIAKKLSTEVVPYIMEQIKSAINKADIKERVREETQEEKLVVNPWAVKHAFLKCGREGKVINEMYGNEFNSITPNRIKYLSFLKRVELDNRFDELNEILNKYGKRL